MRVGIIGAGFFGEKHAQAIQTMEGFELAASSRSDEARLREFITKYGGIAYLDYRELLADPRVDAVVVATPHDTHVEIAIAAAQSGKHTLLEKPMAHTLDGCHRIISAFDGASEPRPKLLVGHVTRFSKAFLVAKELLDSGELGEPIAGLSTMRKSWFEPNRRSWHLDRTQGGGVLMTGGIHALDRLTWLMGSPIASVSAQLATRFHKQEADDMGVIFLRYANGTAGTVYSIGYETGAPEHGTEITCTKGVLRVHSVHGVEVGRDERWMHVPDSGAPSWADDAIVREWADLKRAATTDTDTSITGRDAIHIMRAIFAAEESSRTKGEIALEEL